MLGPGSSVVTPRALHLHAPEVVDEQRGGLAREVDARVGGRLTDRDRRRIRPEEVQAIPDREAIRHECEIGIELGDEVFAHREQRPPTPVAERDAELRQEGGLGRMVGRVEREQLLELIEHEARVAPFGGIRDEPGEVLVECDRREL